MYTIGKFISYSTYQLIFLVFLFGILLRTHNFTELGDDHLVYVNAVHSFREGRDIYKETVKSFQSDDAGNHGFSYLPGFIYIYLPFDVIDRFSVTDDFKVPILLADVAIGLLIIYALRKTPFYALFSIAYWYFNPHIMYKGDYITTDIITIFFMLFAIYFLEKSTSRSALFYAWAVLTKTFAMLLFPILLVRNKSRIRFAIVFIGMIFVASIPFLNDLQNYLNGTLLVHSTRPFQGKPFLFYISFIYKLEFIRVIPTEVYSFVSIFGAWILTSILMWQKKFSMLKNKYILSSLAFFNFYLFSPVLNRTYMLWAIPFLLLSGQSLLNSKGYTKYLWIAFLIGYYAFYYFYLENWGRGLHVDYAYY